MQRLYVQAPLHITFFIFIFTFWFALPTGASRRNEHTHTYFRIFDISVIVIVWLTRATLSVYEVAGSSPVICLSFKSPRLGIAVV